MEGFDSIRIRMSCSTAVGQCMTCKFMTNNRGAFIAIDVSKESVRTSL
jgi:hypothetical protein